MGAAEFEDWREYERLEPFGALRDNWHMAVLAEMFSNVHRMKGAPRAKMADFFYTTPEEKRDRETARTLAALQAVAKRKPE